MANLDVRQWISLMEANGELLRVNGAERQIEIGGLVDLFQRKMGRPALLFDDVPGFPGGYRVLANLLVSVKRIALSLGLPPDSTEMDLVRFWRAYLHGSALIPPREVTAGPCMENVLTGAGVNIRKFPTPNWHEYDGGPMIGTACIVLTRDPDTGWVNLGAYRVQVYDDPTIASVMISKGKHGDIVMRKYFERGQDCPIAVVVGGPILSYMLAGLEIPYGVGEYDVVGGMQGAPVDIIKLPFTGLPVPANTEIAFEGTISPNDVIDEGPFGEWTGYYASGVRKQPVIRIKTIVHRNDPILLGAVPAVPPCDDTFYRDFFRSAAVWHQLEGAGIPGVQGVWANAAAGGRMWLNVAIKQMYPGHPKQAGLVASQCHAGAYANRWVVVVDEDINPADNEQIMWAMATRVDPREDVEIIRTSWSTALDPMSYPENMRALNSRLVVDACRPWSRKDTFPRVARSSKELDDRIRAKWSGILPPGC